MSGGGLCFLCFIAKSDRRGRVVAGGRGHAQGSVLIGANARTGGTTHTHKHARTHTAFLIAGGSTQLCSNPGGLVPSLRPTSYYQYINTGTTHCDSQSPTPILGEMSLLGLESGGGPSQRPPTSAEGFIPRSSAHWRG